jgi:DNA repair exonuclease SbcCD nuclease subunit
MKLGVFTDLHLSNSHSKFMLKEDGVSDLLEAQGEFVKYFVEQTKDCEVLLFLGDYTDRATLDPVTQSYCNMTLKRLAESGKQVILIEGNHCLSDKGGLFTVLSAASMLSNFDNLNFVTEEEHLRLSGVNFYCVPYRSDYKYIEKKIKSINDSLNKSEINVLLFHLPTINAVLDNGVPSKKGVNLSSEITGNFNICLGGDFHRPQQLVNNSKAYYVGAPFSMKYGDTFERGFWKVTLDESGYEIDRIQNPFNYNIAKVAPEAFQDYLHDYSNFLSRSIIKIDSEPSEEVTASILEHRSRFYSLSLQKSRPPRVDRDATYMDNISKDRDLDFISLELDNILDDKIAKDLALKMFQEIFKRIEV